MKPGPFRQPAQPWQQEKVRPADAGLTLIIRRSRVQARPPYAVAMRLDVDDLTVAPLAAEDLDDFVAYRRDPVVARYQSWEPTYSAEDARRLLVEQAGREFPMTGEWMQFGIRRGGLLIGDVAVHPLAEQPDTYELGVTVAPAAQGGGVARRVLVAVVEHLVARRGAHRVIASCDARNDAVRRALGAAGFRHEGTAVDGDWFKGEWTSLETWAVLAREIAARHSP